jgi:hypothetical protein
VRQKYITVMDFKNSEKNNPGRWYLLSERQADIAKPLRWDGDYGDDMVGTQHAKGTNEEELVVVTGRFYTELGLFRIRTMDKVRKPSNSVCYTPSSEPYRIYW